MHDFNLIYTIITIAVVLAVIMSTCAVLIFVERKIAAYIQDRIGPNRVGPAGLLQPLADGLKFLFKEDIIPTHVDRLLYLVAPTISLTTALLAFAVVPFGPTTAAPLPPWAPDPISPNADAAQVVKHANAEIQFSRDLQTYQQKEAEYRKSYQFVIAPNVDIGIVFLFAVSSLTVYGIILGGWSANSKYSLIGGLRSSAQIVSYEIPMGLSVLGVFLLSGSLNLERIIGGQVTPAGDGWRFWYICYQPLAFLLFMISAFAETNRLPFDLPEAEQELVGGYHTEYSALKFAMFFLGEYTHMVTTSFLMVVLFFGGWHFPWIAGPDAWWWVKLIVFGVKMAFFIVFYMMVRWTLPRLRFDQLMGLAWKVLIPLALANLVAVMVVEQLGLSPWWLVPVSVVFLIAAGWIGALPSRSPPSMALHERPGVLTTAR
jgi:NADH-quinone oxidoreductase subunit H